jgi:hypothetical protein
MTTTPPIGVRIPKVLLPRPDVDLSKWAVIACDQFTSEPEYWQQVAALVGDAPSTYHLILPEVYLGTAEEAHRVQGIRQTMQDYLQRGLFVEHEGVVLVERTTDGRTRHGVMLALDLEQYNYSKGAASLIRATEGTILERIPPRVRIRSGAALELPHILVLIDDPERTVIEPLVAQRHHLRQLYDFDLMLGSGHLAGYLVENAALEQQMLAALARLADPVLFARKYGLEPDRPVLLFAVGDGNHSLATAKAIWEQLKNRSEQSGGGHGSPPCCSEQLAEAAPTHAVYFPVPPVAGMGACPAAPIAGMGARPATQINMDHPARYALVEVENVHDAGLVFEPIHRVLFGLQGDLRAALEEYYAGRGYLVPCATAEVMVALVDGQAARVEVPSWPDEARDPRQPAPARSPIGDLRPVGPGGRDAHAFGVVTPQGFSVAYVPAPPTNLAVGTLQSFLDAWGHAGGFARIDYVHGAEVTVRLGAQQGNASFYLPAIAKNDLFKTVIVDGALPRKTFSMGEAKEKRFYIEARRIA